jgi:hypothetical protein
MDLFILFEDVYNKVLEDWITRQIEGTRRELPFKDERDRLCADRVPEYGHRTISKKGSFRFAGCEWQHDLLIPLAGKRLGIITESYWITKVDIYTSYPSGEWIMRIGS